ncbi:MAG: transposase family protein [Chloroflexi bacterium]|nr:transposase family protein [Chloroflexota bacterium]
MTRNSIREYAQAVRERYFKAGKKDKQAMLDEFCCTTHYHRKAAIRLLRHQPLHSPSRRGRKPKYGLGVIEPLKTLWEASDRICSKRLVPFIPELLEALERHGEIKVQGQLKSYLLEITPSTVDRLLRPFRSKGLRRPYSQTRSSSTIKALVPIRTFGEWHDVTPGSVQVDLVMHCGESTGGFHLTTLVVVDVASGWTECQPTWGKGQQRVRGSMHEIYRRLPFVLGELHNDNGGEFLNEQLYPWCKRHGIRQTRGRPYKKNDQAYVEQKNWSVVRRTIGYDRYCTKIAFAQMKQVYRPLMLYVNFFQPLRKLVGKDRQGAKVSKRYDKAQTPYQRLLAAGVLGETERKALQEQYRSLNPVELRAQIERELEGLWKLAEKPQPVNLKSKRAKEPTACG